MVCHMEPFTHVLLNPESHSSLDMLSGAVASRMKMLATISLETSDILSCGPYCSPNGRLVDLDHVAGEHQMLSQLYMSDRLDKFTDHSIIWLYEYQMNVAVMMQLCLMATE